MKKPLKKKYELLERIEYLENDFFNFTQETVKIIEVLTNRIEHKHKKTLIPMARKEVRLYEFLSTIGINEALL